MADRLYLSLWFPNFRLESLPAALTGVLRQFAVIGSKHVSAASAYPISFAETPLYERIYVVPKETPTNAPAGQAGEALEAAVAEATEQLHDDMAYEFEMRWQLWAPEGGGAHLDEAEDAYADPDPDPDTAAPYTVLGDLDTTWSLRPHAVRVLGFGPAFDTAGFEQNGHILVDFGLDTPWVFETEDARPLDQVAQVRIQQNVEKLLAFTLLVEKNCGISSRLLWTESGEPLAAKLIGRLQKVN
ncbi:MAG: hypothetical protein M3O02_05800 [Acidobacteriota bacterium]|nr:hypothetical protein [Acidobacteriota bacterium]